MSSSTGIITRHRIRNTVFSLAVAGLILFLPTLDLTAQVLVAPTVVFVSDRNPTGRMTLLNQSDADQEITIKFSFGIPISDSLGNIFVTLEDSAVTDPRSALEWVKAFPRSVILPSGESQIVRIMARPPKDLPDGEYWARVLVESKKAQGPPVREIEEGQIGAQIHMVTRQAIMLKYRTGDLAANLELINTNAHLTDSTVDLVVDLSSNGNVSYMGMLYCQLYDANGVEIDSVFKKIAVYRTQKRRIELNLPAENHQPPFRVDLKITSEGRTDIDPRDMIAGNDIKVSIAVE